MRLSFASLMSVLIGCASGGSDGDAAPRGPGQGEWTPVPKAQVAAECGLDPDLLEHADIEIDRAYAVVRYGKLCHEYYPTRLYPDGVDETEIVFSAAKTLAGVLTGAAAWRTRALERTGRKTGPLQDSDRIDHWLDEFTFNQDAQVGHVLGMVGQNEDLSSPDLDFMYDTAGGVQINRLNDVVAAAIAQDPALGSSVHEFLVGYLFEPLGMRHSDWDGDARIATTYRPGTAARPSMSASGTPPG